MATVNEQSANKNARVASRLHRAGAECGWLALGCLVVLLVVRSEVDQTETDAMVANRKRINDMTRIERDRLEHNQKQFQSLSPAAKNLVNELHAAVTADANLSTTLTTYHNWMGTLPPDQRERVFNAKPDQRSQVIESLVQGAWPVHRIRDVDPYPGFENGGNGNGRFQIPFWMRPSRGGLVFSEPEFESLIAGIAEWLKSDLRPEGDSSVDKLRYRVKVVDAMVARVSEGANIGRPDKDATAIPDQLIQRLINSLPMRGASRIMPQIRNQPALFLQTIVRTLGLEMSKLLEEGGTKSTKLNGLREQMPPFRKNEIDQLDEIAREAFLSRIWYEREHPDIMDAMKRIAAELNREKPPRNPPPPPRRFPPPN